MPCAEEPIRINPTTTARILTAIAIWLRCPTLYIENASSLALTQMTSSVSQTPDNTMEQCPVGFRSA
ncbi:hypothetical protein PHET_04419 [Paragonimus heterotremus]|uniref:Uncharacterized protein n=1 Tax=Paragonimus heterotremus TaxID=100268 RepID=A0A8J4SMP8_9TREM|nr:hypothetical protein PHET_04419 [Paragonimus heterotremus]